MDLLYILDISGTAVFAIAGTFKAIKHELDILGVLTLALITGAGGGIFRDLLLGDNPPAAFRDETYFIACIAAALIAASKLGADRGITLILAIAVTTHIRLIAMKTGLALPKVKQIPGFKGSSDKS